MKTVKQLIALNLVLVFLLSLIPGVAFAAETTAAAPEQVSAIAGAEAPMLLQEEEDDTEPGFTLSPGDTYTYTKRAGVDFPTFQIQAPEEGFYIVRVDGPTWQDCTTGRDYTSAMRMILYTDEDLQSYGEYNSRGATYYLDPGTYHFRIEKNQHWIRVAGDFSDSGTWHFSLVHPPLYLIPELGSTVHVDAGTTEALHVYFPEAGRYIYSCDGGYVHAMKITNTGYADIEYLNKSFYVSQPVGYIFMVTAKADSDASFLVKAYEPRGEFGESEDNLFWELDRSTGQMTISGSGSMGYIPMYDAPWKPDLDNIRSLVIKSGVTDVADDAFYDCHSLQTVILEEGVTRIGVQAFRECSALTDVSLPNTLESISFCAFSDCTALESLVVPPQVTFIGSDAFQNCPNLRELWIPPATTQIYGLGIPNPSALTIYGAAGSRAESYANSIGAAFVAVAAPSIDAQPQSVTLAVGETARFSVGASGTDLCYQWQYKAPGESEWQNSSASGANTAAITVKAIAARNGQQYRCVISNKLGTVVSDAAAMTVQLPIVITQQPQDFEGFVGDTATFTVKATGDGLKYQWQYKDPGGSTWTNSSFKTASMSCKLTAARNGRQYHCVIKDAYGNSLTSDPATITVKTPLAIMQQPQDFEGFVGDTATFTVKATGDGLTYQWQYKDPGKDWANSSFKTASMSCKLTAARNGRQYRCIVQDAYENRLYSDAATITVKPAITITQQPKNFVGAVGETATFTVGATGEGLKYQWQYKEPGSSTWLNSSFKTATMTCKITAARDGREYRCIVTDAHGRSITSEAAMIIIGTKLAITSQPQDFSGKVGATAKFSVAATGDGLTYQWQYKDVGGEWANSSFKTSSMTCKITAARDGRQYRCIVTDAHGVDLTSDAATIHVTA